FDAPASSPANSASNAAPGPTVEIQVSDGRVTLARGTGPTEGIIEKIQATVRHAPTDETPLSVALTATVSPPAAGAPVAAAPLKAEINLKKDPTTGQFAPGRGHLALQTSGLELTALQPVVTRVQASLDTAGTLSADMTADWD